MKGTIRYVGILRGYKARPTQVLVCIEPDTPKYDWEGICVDYVIRHDKDDWRDFNLKPGDRVNFRVRDPWHLVRL